MDDWLEDLTEDPIWKGLKDALGNLENRAATKIESKLDDLQPGDRLGDSPLAAAVAKAVPVTAAEVASTQDRRRRILRSDHHHDPPHEFPDYPHTNRYRRRE